MRMDLTAVFKKVPEGYIGWVEELPGANTQGDTLEEARSNLEEAIQLVIDANRMLSQVDVTGESLIRERVSVEVCEAA
jgi:predicted RNase H-like HicB family nuclease